MAFEIASAAVTMERSSRHLYLQQVCESDLELRATVEELLNEAEAESAGGSFTLRAPWGPVDLWADEVAFTGTDRYQVRKRLGSGAFGTVYEAWDAQEQQRVAVKVLQQRKPAFLLRFKREFRSLANLKGHPNIVRLHELHGDEKHWFYTMELVEGQSFLSYVRPGGVRDGERLRKSLYQLWAGVRFLHERRQLHRDLKPGNVMVSTAGGEDSGRVVILDFGLVKELGDVGIEQSVAIAGSPAYMAPEQGEKGVLSEGTDWYAVGVMLYQALTGNLPFSGTLFEVLLRKRQNEAPDVRELDPSIDADLSGICSKLLSRDLDQRLAGAAELEGVWKPDATPVAAAPLSKGNEEIFVGRGEERRALEGSLQAVLSGRQAVVGVVGPSGIGKSALVRQFLKDVKEQAPDSLVLTGRCYEAESVPFKTLDAVIDELSQHQQSLSREEMAAILPRESHLVPKVFPVMGEVKAIRDSAGTRVQAAIPDAQEVRQRAFVAMRELLGRLADRRPVVVWVDDLQWGDLDSLAFVEEVVCGAQAPSMLWVFSYRQEDRDTSPVLLSLREQVANGERWKEIAIRELAGDEARLLAGRLLQQSGGGAPDGATAAAAPANVDLLVTESGGSPLFLQELVRSAGEVVGGGLGLKQVILRRVSQLPDVAREVMEVVALAGQRIESDEIVQVLHERDAPDLHRALSRCLEERLLRTAAAGRDRGVVETYHDQIREAVSASLAAARKQELHRRLADMLSKLPGVDAERLIPHYEGAGNNRGAYDAAVQAARQAESQTAFDKAARLYQIAMSLGRRESLSSNQLLDLHRQLGRALALAGRGKQAAEAYASAASLAPEGAVRLRMKLEQCTQLLRSGYADQGLAELRPLARLLGVPVASSKMGILLLLGWERFALKCRAALGLLNPSSGPALAEARPLSPMDELRVDLLRMATLTLTAVHPVMAALFISRYYKAAQSMGLSAGHVALATGTEASIHGGVGTPANEICARLIHQARLCAAASSDVYDTAMTSLMHALTHFQSGRFPETLRLANEAEAMLREKCTGVAWEISSCRILSLCSLSWSGAASEYSVRLTGFIQEGRQRSDQHTAISLRLLTYSHYPFLFADEPDQGIVAVEEAMEAWGRQDFDLQRYGGTFSIVECLLYKGDGPAAYQYLMRAWPDYLRSMLGQWTLFDLFLLILRARAAIASIRGTPASSEYTKDAMRCIRKIRRIRIGWAPAVADALDALLCLVDGRPQEAIQKFRSAEQQLSDAELRLYARSCQYHLGGLLGGEAGRELRTRAIAWMRAEGIRNPAHMVAGVLPLPQAVLGRT